MKPSGGHDEELQKAERLAYLIDGYLRNALTEIESNELDDWITESDENLALFEKLTDEDNIEASMQLYQQIEKGKHQAYETIQERIGVKEKKNRTFLPFLIAAALLLLAISLYLLWPKYKDQGQKQLVQTNNDQVLPAGTDKAVLTLSDGRTVMLDSNGQGLVAKEGNIRIEKTNEGQLVYKGTVTTMRYNTISTPRGGQYTVVLGDGTKVWLNAESSLKFPAGFNDKQRNVELKGEGYFEVAKSPDQPFIVKIITPLGEGGTVEVLGTHFNINAYSDKGLVKTTLLEGKVRIEHNGTSRQLLPGEQALIASSIQVNKADENEAVAWKDGKFLFHNATVHTIGEQIKRWYDVEVEYEGSITQHFNTEASRNIPLQELLKGLEGTNEVQFILQGKKLLIKPATVFR